jgi:hypothetical protein
MSARFLLSLALLTVVPMELVAQGCLSRPSISRRGTHQNWTRSHDDGVTKRLTVRWQKGDCEIRVDARGDFDVRPDLTAFTSVDNGGYVEIEEIDGDRERKVRISGAAGSLVARWTVDGANGFDVDRERWLADMLLALERRTAMFAKARIPALLRQGGASAVLAEAERMETDHTRRVYYTTLLGLARLDEGMLERMLTDVAGMSSDFERAEMLRAVARHGPMTERVTRASINVAHRMGSDFEKRRALSAGLESVTTPETRNALFNAAATMSSSFELAELLIAAQNRSLVDSVSGAAYFKAVERVSSDFERRRTLSALLKKRPEAVGVLAGVLRASSSINSDFELASLLVEFAKTTPVRGELRELYLRATRSISSDHEYRRALQALLEQDRQI